MATVNLGSWPKGIDMLSEVTGLPEGAVVDAVNGVIVTGGQFVRRDGETLTVSDVYHSGYTTESGKTYACRANELGVMTYDGTTVSFSAIHTLKADAPVNYTELNGKIIFSSRFELGTIDPVTNGVLPLGVPEPTFLDATVTSYGGLRAGRYGVGITIGADTGEEGAMSTLVFVSVPEGGGITVTLPLVNTPLEPHATHFNVYRTEPDGDILYRDGTCGLVASYFLGNGTTLGAPATTHGLSRMAPGTYVRAWQGRLLTARSDTLRVSDPLRYGLHDPRHGFVRLPALVHWVEGIPSGVYVGTSSGVYFLDGQRPDDWQQRLVDPGVPLKDASAVIPAASFGDALELPQGTDYVVAWLTSAGFCFGLPQGVVIRPQSDRLDIRSLSGARGSLAAFGGVLTAIVQ